MTIRINNGIDQLKRMQEQQRQKDAHRSNDLVYNRLCGLLMTVRTGNQDANLQFCQGLRPLDLEQRRQAIEQRYGATCLAKAEPLLLQLHSLEQAAPPPQ